ncbi:Lin0512 family protein [Cognatiyoonia sp. IB215182]|uniref:Lin0512 family protein n=1 Tax=Cognatiyoonia sp. IB215182 TaxID=3097353 RepID=UPI0039B74A70
MEQRIIIEMGMGNDLHGMDYQKAAARAIEDAIRHSTLPIFESLELPHTDMRLKVTIGAQEPDKIDADALKSGLPRGHAVLSAVKGGLNVPNPETGETAVVATAAVEAFLPTQKGKWKMQ